MDEISVSRGGGELSAPLMALYPAVIGMPLSAFLLHQDTKSHLSLEMDAQTTALLGSNQDLQSLLTEGFGSISTGISDISDKLDEANEHLSLISASLERSEGHLEDIKYEIKGLRHDLFMICQAVVSAILQVKGELRQLNETSLSIESLLRQPQLAWARERAATAARAMQVGDLETAKREIQQAVKGYGPHSGAPTHVELLLLDIEVSLRMGTSNLAEVFDSLERARRYLNLEPSITMVARYEFAKGSYYLSLAEFPGNPAALGFALEAFTRAAKYDSYKGMSLVYISIVQTLLKMDDKDVAKTLFEAIVFNPKIAIEITRLKHRRISAGAVNEALSLAKTHFYRKNDLRDLFVAQLGRVDDRKTRTGCQAQR